MVDATRALSSLEGSGRQLDAAWAKHLMGIAPGNAVLDALAAYQNPDGGFGKALEPDIAAAVSQPFAARIALRILSAIEPEVRAGMLSRLSDWMVREQDEEGCWRLPSQVHDAPLAPWFAAWQFPSLNPALCLAGWATRLGIGSDEMQRRVRELFERMASLDEIATGEYYTLLPYVEYVPWVQHPRRGEFLRALAERISETALAGRYDDASHFFEHLGPADAPLAGLVDRGVVATWLDKLEAEQQDDGSWPTPYALHWQSWTTASALAVLQDFGRI